MKKRQPLSRLLAWRFALVATIPLGVVAALVWFLLVPRMHTDVRVRHQALAQAVAGQVSAHLAGVQRELSAVAHSIEMQSHREPSSFQGMLDAHAGGGDVFEAIYMVDGEARVCSVGLPVARRQSREDLLGLDVSRRSFLRQVMATREQVWSETFLSTVSGRLAVALAIPMADSTLVGEIAIDRLSEFIAHLPAHWGWEVAILDRIGRIIADSRSAVGGQIIPLRPRVDDDLAGSNTIPTREFELEGGQFIGSIVDISDIGWKVLVAQLRSEASRPISNTFWTVGAGGALALLSALLAGWMLAGKLSERVRHYTEQAQAITQGDYDQPWSSSTTLEFDELAASLQRMSAAIREREHALIVSEARYRSIVSNTPVAIFEFDHDGVFTLCEGRGLQTLGLEPRRLVGTSVFDLFSHHRELDDYAVRALKGESLQFTAQVGPSVFEFYYNPVLSTLAGRISVIGIAVDITERQRREEELRQRTDELTRFTYAVSHDLKSPLVTIMSFLGFLKKDMQNQDADRVAKDMGYIHNAAEKMNRMLNELLELARIGRQVNPVAQIPLQDLVQEVLALLAGSIVTSGARVKVAQDPVLLSGDRPRLVEVFQNLLDNAIKFSGNEAAPEIEIGVEDEDGEVVIFVKDHGQGIDPRFRHKLFGLFEKLEPSREGSGIGLALVKRIVEVHGGRIWVESAGLGQGTTFRFTLAGTRRVGAFDARG